MVILNIFTCTCFQGHAIFIEMPIQCHFLTMFELISELLSINVPPRFLSLHYYSYVIVFQLTKSGFCFSSFHFVLCFIYILRFHFIIFVCIWVLACAHEYRHLQNLEDDVRSSRIGVTSGCEPPVLGTKNQTHALCESGKPFIKQDISLGPSCLLITVRHSQNQCYKTLATWIR